MELLTVLEQYPVVFYVFALAFGLIVGSFLNVVILRMPPILEYHWKKDFAEYSDAVFSEEKPPGIALTRSHCPQCKRQLKAYQNIPLLGFVFLRGKCGFCRSSISLRYPIIELLTGLLTVLMAFFYGIETQLIAACLLVWFLIVITWIDLDTYLIPDQLSLTLLWLGLFFSLFEFSVSPAVAIIGSLVGYLSLWLLFHVFKIFTGKEGMGYGDFKLLAAGGAWLGFEPLIVVLFVSSISGLTVALIQFIIKRGQQKIPFGPYLSIGIFVAYVWGAKLMDVIFLVG